MNTEVTGAVKRLPKKLWHLGKLMIKLVRISHAQLRTKHSYRIKIARLEQERDQKLNAMEIRHKELVAEIFCFAEERKSEILEKGKSVTTAAGQVGWRATAPSVLLEAGYTEKSVARWLATHHKKYVRFTPILNKEKILQDFRDGVLRKIKGLRVKHGTEFFISLSPRGKDKPETISIDVTG